MNAGKAFLNRDGIALVAALSLLALLGLLVVAGVASTTIAQHAAWLALSDDLLTTSADYAAGAVLGDPGAYGFGELPLGRTRSFDVAVPAAAPVRATVSATRLPGGVLWLVADASLAGSERGHRRVNLVARFPFLGPAPVAPLVARASMSLAADVVVLADSAGEPDCAASAAAPSAQTADSAALFQTASQWAALDSAPGVRHVRGDTTIAGGTFAGILLVDGALTVSGPFVLTGLALARGPIHSTGGLTVVGALISQAASSPAIDLAGASVRFSPCTVARVLRVASPPKLVRGRAWAELF